MTRRNTAVLAVVVGAFVTAPAVGAADVGVSGIVDGRYLYNTGVDASALDVRVEFDLDAGPLTVGAVYRAYQLSDPLYNPAGVNLPNAQIKHRYAEFAGGPFSARAGHFFATFGRGLTLRSYEDAELEHDTALDGILTEYGAGPVTVTALAGVAEEHLYGSRYRDHVVRGFRVELPLGGRVGAAASLVERSRTDRDEELELPDEVARFEDSVEGAELSLWLGPLTLAGEYAGRSGENPATGERSYGYAAYASGTVELGRLTVFGEFKDYRDYDHYLVNPPTCVRDHVWTLMNRATYEIDLDDERGFLVEGTAPVGEELSVTGGASEARRHSGELAHWEIFAQVDHSLCDRASGAVAASWSREYEFGRFVERAIGVADIDLTLATGQVLEAGLEVGWTDNRLAGYGYHDYLGSMTFYPSSSLTVSSVLEATTDRSEEREVWTILEVRALLPEDVELSVAFGSERRGKKCSGGVCYVEPEFEGLRVKVGRYF